IPLSPDSEGVLRVANTRVTLDTVIAAFQEGATPETIVQQYPTLGLADVYAVIGYYLYHRLEVHTYLQQRAQRSAQIREHNETGFDPSGVRGRLLARRQEG